MTPEQRDELLGIIGPARIEFGDQLVDGWAVVKAVDLMPDGPGKLVALCGLYQVASRYVAEVERDLSIYKSSGGRVH